MSPSATSTGTSEVRTEEGRLSLFVAIDRRSTFAFAPLHERATRRIAADFLRRALAPALPYAAPTVLIDRGFQFFDRTPPSAADTALPLDHEPAGWRVHAFTYACEQLDIGHA